MLLQVIAQSGQLPSESPRWCGSPEHHAGQLKGAQGRHRCRRSFIPGYPTANKTSLRTSVILAATCIFAVTWLPRAYEAKKRSFAGAVLPKACVAPSAGQIAALLRMAKLQRPSAETDQTSWKHLSFVEQSGAVPMYADSVRRKRKTKMNKHKHRKRLKKMRHGSK